MSRNDKLFRLYNYAPVVQTFPTSGAEMDRSSPRKTERLVYK